MSGGGIVGNRETKDCVSPAPFLIGHVQLAKVVSS